MFVSSSPQGNFLRASLSRSLAEGPHSLWGGRAAADGKAPAPTTETVGGTRTGKGKPARPGTSLAGGRRPSTASPASSPGHAAEDRGRLHNHPASAMKQQGSTQAAGSPNSRTVEVVSPKHHPQAQGNARNLLSRRSVTFGDNGLRPSPPGGAAAASGLPRKNPSNVAPVGRGRSAGGGRRGSGSPQRGRGQSPSKDKGRKDWKHSG